MRYNQPSFVVLICAISILLVDECSSQQPKAEAIPIPALRQPNVEIVSLTLQTYQVGKLTIDDFIRDAGLVNATFPPPYDVGTNPSPNFLLKCVFKTTGGSPWAIYETGLDEGNQFGSGFTRTRKYVVGDTNKPICILAFGNGGKLTSISPVAITNSFPARPNRENFHHLSIPQPNDKIVAQTLQTYVVGKTTIKDFIRDADLVKATPFPSTYLNSKPPPDFLAKNMFSTQAGSFWVIYKTSVEQNTSKGGVTVTPIRKYVVGNHNKPISILEFDNEGKLTSISPAP